MIWEKCNVLRGLGWYVGIIAGIAVWRRRYVVSPGCGWQTRCLATVWVVDLRFLGQPVVGLQCGRLNCGLRGVA